MSYGAAVSTSDFDSEDLGSIPSRTTKHREMKKLFRVEIEGGQSERWSIFSNGLHIVASNFEEAGRKALEYKAHKDSIKPMFDSDGSLKNEDVEPLKLKKIELITEELIL